MSGIVDMRRFRHTDLTIGDLSSFTFIGPRGQANHIKKIPSNGGSGATLYHNITARHGHIYVCRKMLNTTELKLIDTFGNTMNWNNINVSFTPVLEV